LKNAALGRVCRAADPVVANGRNGTAFHRCRAELFLFCILRLLVNVGVPAIGVPGKIRRRGFAAQIAIDALVVHIELPRHVVGIAICKGCHIPPLSVTAIQYTRAIGGFNTILRAAEPEGRVLGFRGEWPRCAGFPEEAAFGDRRSAIGDRRSAIGRRRHRSGNDDGGRSAPSRCRPRPRRVKIGENCSSQRPQAGTPVPPDQRRGAVGHRA